MTSSTVASRTDIRATVEDFVRAGFRRADAEATVRYMVRRAGFPGEEMAAGAPIGQVIEREAKDRAQGYGKTVVALHRVAQEACLRAGVLLCSACDEDLQPVVALVKRAKGVSKDDGPELVYCPACRTTNELDEGILRRFDPSATAGEDSP